MFMGLAADERRALSDLFDELGPDVPTLCEGWQSKDLAAHLALRDRRPDAAAGIQVKALSGYTERVQRGYADKPWAQLIELVRTGPPALSPFRLPGLSELVNGTEFFVHHEDLRRGQPDWEPRVPDPARDAALWKTLRMAAKLAFRRSPVGIVLRRTDGEEITVKRGPNTVTIVGEPGELLLNAAGRSAVRVSFNGDQAAIGIVQGLDRAL
jgi:uncharacterized protein (TIGR03085 family)